MNKWLLVAGIILIILIGLFYVKKVFTNDETVTVVKETVSQQSAPEGLEVDSYGSINWSDIDTYPVGCDMGEAIMQLGESLICAPVWNALPDIPVGSPTTRSTSKLSLASQIYDFVTGLGYIVDDESVEKSDLIDSGALSFDWDDDEISNGLTVSSLGSVSWQSLGSYPDGCSENQAVRVVGDELTCIEIPSPSTIWVDSGNITYLTSASDDLAIGGADNTANFYFDNGAGLASLASIKVGGDTDYLSISSDGGLALFGAATVYDDLRVPVTSTTKGGSKEPTFTKIADNGGGSQGVFDEQFSPKLEQELYFTAQLPHSYKEGSDIHPHVHWAPTSIGSGDVVWGLECTWSNINEAFGNTSIISSTDAADQVNNKMQLASFTAINGAGKLVSSMLACRVFRDATNLADDYSDPASLLEIDFHFQIDKLGTAEEYPT